MTGRKLSDSAYFGDEMIHGIQIHTEACWEGAAYEG